jgi:predicted alpha/beta hydrolase
MKESLTILTKNFHHLGASYFRAESPNGITIIINPAMAVRQRYYFDYAAFLAQQGFQVFTYDYLGIGESKSKSLLKLDASILDWAQTDFNAVINHAKESFPYNTLVVIGHSIGGQIIGMTSASSKVDAFVMVAAQTPYWKNFETKTKPKLWFFWHAILPVLTKTFGFFPASKLRLFEDLPKSAALQWMRWAKSEKFVFGEYPGIRQTFEALKQPAKVYSFSDDSIAPYKAVKNLLGYYTNLKIEHNHMKPEDLVIDSIGHFGFFKKRFQSTLWPESTEWILKNTRKGRQSAA